LMPDLDMTVLPGLKSSFHDWWLFLTVWFKYFEDAAESQHRARRSDDRRS
jgi:hypothetical protein